jgi:hypothetical protein
MGAVSQVFNAQSDKFISRHDKGDALVIPVSYGDPVFRVTNGNIFLLRGDGSIWEEYPIPETNIVVYLEYYLTTLGF